MTLCTYWAVLMVFFLFSGCSKRSGPRMVGEKKNSPSWKEEKRKGKIFAALIFYFFIFYLKVKRTSTFFQWSKIISCLPDLTKTFTIDGRNIILNRKLYEWPWNVFLTLVSLFLALFSLSRDWSHGCYLSPEDWRTQNRHLLQMWLHWAQCAQLYQENRYHQLIQVLVILFKLWIKKGFFFSRTFMSWLSLFYSVLKIQRGKIRKFLVKLIPKIQEFTNRSVFFRLLQIEIDLALYAFGRKIKMEWVI